MSWTKQSMIGIYEFPALNCPEHATYPDKMAANGLSLSRHARQIRCENSKTYKFQLASVQKTESAVVTIPHGQSCKLIVALVLGREDADTAYEKSRLEASQAHAVELAKFFASQQRVTLGTVEPQTRVVNGVIDKKANGAICENFK